jgi:hypothetical protein
VIRALLTFAIPALLTGCAGPGAPPAPPTTEGWQLLEPGLELGFLLPPPPLADGLVRVLRIDPERFDLRLVAASAHDRRNRTAREWCAAHGMVAALNAAMYQEDHSTSVSLMRTRTHTVNPRLTRDRAVLAFDRRDPDAPPVKIIDLECEDFRTWEPRYGSFVQSIRMLSCSRQNVWQQHHRKSSAAAVGIDGAGRVIFVHSRIPSTIHDLIDALTQLPLDLTGLMYAEGGPEAQLYVRGQDRDFEFVGTFEGDTAGIDDELGAWPVPNVLGIVRRAQG